MHKWILPSNVGWSLIKIDGFQVRFQINMVFHSMKIVFILANNVDPGEMPHLGHFIWVFTVCQSMYLAISCIQRVNSYIFLYMDTIRIRIHGECDGGIEKSVLRITDWHQAACRVMTNGDHEGRIFHSILTQIMDSFSCSTLNTSFYIGKTLKGLIKVIKLFYA